MTDSASTSDSGSPSSVGPASSRSRHFRWWSHRRATWSAVLGGAAVLVTSIAGATSVSYAPHKSFELFECESPLCWGMLNHTVVGSLMFLVVEPPDTMHQFGAWGTVGFTAPTLDTLARRGVPVSARMVLSPQPAVQTALVSLRVGAPFRCFGVDQSSSPVRTGPVRKGIGPTRGIVTVPWRHRSQVNPAGIDIPIHPLPGLAYSWVFWSALAYIPLTGFSCFRIRRRLRKGLCPACTYDLAGAARCPECGTVVRRAAPDPCAVV